MSLELHTSDASGVPYYRQLVDQLRAAIVAKRLQPGEALPSVRELAAQLRVSLITVRRAYAELEAAGWVERRQGQGTFVADSATVQDTRSHRQQAEQQLARAVDEALANGLDAARVLRAVRSRLTKHGFSLSHPREEG